MKHIPYLITLLLLLGACGPTTPLPPTDTPALIAATETPSPSPTPDTLALTPESPLATPRTPSGSPLPTPTNTPEPLSPTATATRSAATATLQAVEFDFLLALEGGRPAESLTVQAEFANNVVSGRWEPAVEPVISGEARWPASRVILTIQPPYPRLVIEHPGYLPLVLEDVTAAQLTEALILRAGDINADGVIDQSDIDLITQVLGSAATTEFLRQMDFTADGLITQADVALVVGNME